MYYRYIPKTNLDPNQICNTLWNSQTYYSKCVAYCCRKGKYLTVKQLRIKECLRKQCSYLQKIEDRPFWKYREQIKNKKKLAKADE